MNKQDTHFSATEWAERLSTQVLPTGPFVGKLVLHTIEEDKLTYKQIAKQANKDPVFSYHIMSRANKNKDQDAPFSKTLVHALSMLGTEKLKEITLSLPTLKHKLGNTKQVYYARAVSASLLASYLAREFSTIKQLGQTEDLYWGALFCGVPMWFLWEFATSEMKQVRHAIHTGFKTFKQAETEVFGCTIPEIAEQLIKRLDLPPLTKACYSEDNQLTPKQWIKMSRHVAENGRPFKVDDQQINHISSRTSFAITLANLLAYYASQDWYSSSTLRVQKAISVYLGMPLNQAISLTHQCAISMSRDHPIPGIMLPAAKLLLPPREKLKNQQTIDEEKSILPIAPPSSIATPPGSLKRTQPEAETENEFFEKNNQEDTSISQVADQQETIKPAVIKPQKTEEKETMPEDVTPKKSQRGDKDIFIEFTDLMLKNPDNFVDLHELMNAATQCVSYGLGLQKAIVALVNTDETRLKSYYNVGTKDFPQLSNYQADLTKPSLFSRLIEKPSSIWVKQTSKKSIWAMVPPEFKVASGAKEFFLMSIFVNKKPVAVFYADSGEEDYDLTESDYKKFKYMCGAATHCLQYLAAKRAKKT